MSGQNNRYSQTSRYGHLYNTDTSLLRTVRLVPEMPKISYIAYLYNTDTSVKWTLGSVPLVSVLIRIDGIRIIHFYCFPFMHHHLYFSIVLSPAPHFYCFPSTTTTATTTFRLFLFTAATTTTFLLFSLQHDHHTVKPL